MRTYPTSAGSTWSLKNARERGGRYQPPAPHSTTPHRDEPLHFPVSMTRNVAGPRLYGFLTGRAGT